MRNYSRVQGRPRTAGVAPRSWTALARGRPCARSRRAHARGPRPAPVRPGASSGGGGTHREAPRGVHLDHAAQQALAVGRDEVRHVEHAPLHLLQQLPQVVVVEGQRPLPAGPGHRGGGPTAGRDGGGAGERAGGASPQAGRTESRRSSTRLPCGHRTSPPVDSTGVGAGAGPGSFRGSRGPRGASGRSWPRGRRQGQEARPRPGGPRSPGQGGPLGGTGTRMGARGGLATYPDHLRAGIVGGPGGKGSSQGRRLSTHRAPSPPASGPAPGPQQVETEGGALPAPPPPQTLPGTDAPLWDPQAHQEAPGLRC